MDFITYQKGILFAQRVGLVGITYIVIGLRNLLLLPILTKHLEIFEYGIWSQVIITVSLLMPIATLGLQSTLSRIISSQRNEFEVKEVFYSVLFTVIIWSFFISAIGYQVSDIFASMIMGDRYLKPFIQITFILVALNAIDEILLSFFTASKQIKKYCFFSIIQNMLEVIAIAFAVKTGNGIFGALIALFICKVALFVIILLNIINNVGFKVPHFSNLNSYLKYSLPMISTTIFAWLIHSSDQYMIGYFLDLRSVGLYSAAYSIGFFLKIFIDPIGIVLFPTVSKLWDESKKSDVKNYIEHSLKYYLMIAIPASFGLSVLGKTILLIFSTEDFIASANVIPFIVTGLLMYGIYNILSKILACVMRTDLIAISLGITAAINFVLNLILIPYNGVLGAAFASFITYTFAGVWVLFLTRKYLKININWHFLFKCIISSMVMVFVLVKLNGVGIVVLMLNVIFSGIVYFICLYSLNSFDSNEIKVIKSIIGFVVENKVKFKLLGDKK